MKLIQVQNASPGVMCTFLFFFLEEVPFVRYIRSILDKNLSFTFFSLVILYGCYSTICICSILGLQRYDCQEMVSFWKLFCASFSF